MGFDNADTCIGDQHLDRPQAFASSGNDCADARRIGDVPFDENALHSFHQHFLLRLEPQLCPRLK